MQWCRDVASGADRHLDIGLQVVEAHPLFPYFLEKRLAIPTSITCLPPFLKSKCEVGLVKKLTGSLY